MKEHVIIPHPIDCSVIDKLRHTNPLCGFCVDGIEVWGDKKSIEAVKRWHHSVGVAEYLRNEVLTLRLK